MDDAQHIAHSELKEWQALCYGCCRFLIIATDSNEYTLDEFNAGYPEELKQKHLTRVGNDE